MDEPNSNLETTSWEAAWQAARTLLPATTHMTPGSLLAAAEKAGKLVHVTSARDMVADATDSTVLRKLLADAKPDEAVIVVTDRSFLRGGAPFVFRTSRCEAFADAYLQAIGEVVISGADVVLVCPESKFVVLYHHEGHVAVIR